MAFGIHRSVLYQDMTIKKRSILPGLFACLLSCLFGTLNAARAAIEGADHFTAFRSPQFVRELTGFLDSYAGALCKCRLASPLPPHPRG